MINRLLSIVVASYAVFSFQKKKKEIKKKKGKEREGFPSHRTPFRVRARNPSKPRFFSPIGHTTTIDHSRHKYTKLVLRHRKRNQVSIPRSGPNPHVRACARIKRRPAANEQLLIVRVPIFVDPEISRGSRANGNPPFYVCAQSLRKEYRLFASTWN